MEDNALLTMKGISKAFPGVQALADVDFTLRRGEIHALMGENGAGKSTLIKVLTGVEHQDHGHHLPGRAGVHAKSPLHAQALGISTVYQEVNLCPNLSVAENILIGREPRRAGAIDWRAHERTGTPGPHLAGRGSRRPAERRHVSGGHPTDGGHLAARWRSRPRC